MDFKLLYEKIKGAVSSTKKIVFGTASFFSEKQFSTFPKQKSLKMRQNWRILIEGCKNLSFLCLFNSVQNRSMSTLIRAI